MEVKEADMIVIAKPVASRPTCSGFKSFSELLAIDSSPPNVYSENIVPAIRPKTVRFKSVVDRASSTTFSSQADQSGLGISISSDKVLKPTLVYKPQAKLVSKATVSLLANMGNFADAPTEYANHEKTRTRVKPNLNRTSPSHADTDQTRSKMGCRNMEDDTKVLPATASSDRSSYDGYNWRKYGQKQVKGSEYPRSYYKCTHPNCPVKKKVERPFDGQIAEIVYKGEHNHSKPRTPKQNPSQALGFASDGTCRDTNIDSRSNDRNERNECPDSRVETHDQGKDLLPYTTRKQTFGIGENSKEASKEGAHDESRSKRKKNENQSSEVCTLGECIQEPSVVVQSCNDSEIIGDRFRWRKYGQKVVKGNPYPRSYYRCSNPKCSVRKHVERASDDPRAFVTTYEGKHNHDMPHRNTNNVAASDSNSPAVKDNRRR